MAKRLVWTRQSAKILDELDQNGRYIVKKSYIEEKMEEHAKLYFETYTWYSNKAKNLVEKPDDVIFPIWVSLTESSMLGLTEGNVLLELSIDEEALILVDQEKWGYVVNYLYIPKDEMDDQQHEAMLRKFNLDETEAYMSPFYPAIKAQIIKSWDRVFTIDQDIKPENLTATIWEIKSENVVRIIRE